MKCFGCTLASEIFCRIYNGTFCRYKLKCTFAIGNMHGHSSLVGTCTSIYENCIPSDNVIQIIAVILNKCTYAHAHTYKYDCFSSAWYQATFVGNSFGSNALVVRILGPSIRSSVLTASTEFRLGKLVVPKINSLRIYLSQQKFTIFNSSYLTYSSINAFRNQFFWLYALLIRI